MRKPDIIRVKRIGWVIPIIGGFCRNVLLQEDEQKIRYYINPVKHLVVLKKNTDGTYNFTTSFKIDRQAKKQQIRELFKIKNPPVL